MVSENVGAHGPHGLRSSWLAVFRHLFVVARDMKPGHLPAIQSALPVFVSDSSLFFFFSFFFHFYTCPSFPHSWTFSFSSSFFSPLLLFHWTRSWSCSRSRSYLNWSLVIYSWHIPVRIPQVVHRVQLFDVHNCSRNTSLESDISSLDITSAAVKVFDANLTPMWLCNGQH